MTALSSFGRWVYLMQQIHEARYYIERSEELGHPHLWTSYDAILDFLAHFKGALSSYGKCFVSAGPGRGRFESSVVFGTDKHRLKQHNVLIDLRHKYVAHGDENEFESVNVVQEDTADELLLHLQYGISFPFDRLYELSDLIRFVEVYLVDRQQALMAAISREVGKPARVLQGAADVPNPSFNTDWRDKSAPAG